MYKCCITWGMFQHLPPAILCIIAEDTIDNTSHKLTTCDEDVVESDQLTAAVSWCTLSDVHRHGC